MEILRTLEAMREWRAGVERDKRVGFAPTMGNLHAGHLALIEAAKKHSDIAVASIFVNPMQFGATEDLDAYPRTLTADLASLEAAGTSAVFTPNVSDIYPDGIDQHTSVDVPGLTDVLCGASRPGHFRGVTTVVAKLLGIVRPDVAVFGAKDLQQVLVIKKMINDLLIDTRVVTVATKREDDGLAMSSRNSHLNEEERKRAAIFAQVLSRSAAALKVVGAEVTEIVDAAKLELKNAGFGIDYIEVRRTRDLAMAHSTSDAIALFGAVRIGNTRLIDNHLINP